VQAHKSLPVFHIHPWKRTVYGCESELVVQMTVEEPSFLAANGLFIAGGIDGTLTAVGVVVYIKKFRQQPRRH